MGYIYDKYQRLKPVFTRDYLTRTYKSYMYDRTLSMFKYHNLPDTIPEDMFEYYLQYYGSCIVTEVKGKLYALHGNFGGFIDPYYRPTLYIVANPALEFSAQLKINSDCVFCINDKLWTGLEPLIARYAYLIAENLITLRQANIMLRIVALLSAPDDKTKAEAELYLKKLEEGKLSVIGENRFFEGVNLQSPPSNNGSYLTQFIELHQYLLGTFYSEIGLKANFNMKREAIMAEETSLNDDVIVSLVETMYACRLANVERINKLYGTNITVEFAGEWRRNEIERDLDLIASANTANISLQPVAGDGDAELVDYLDDKSEESGIVEVGSEAGGTGEDGADGADGTDGSKRDGIERNGSERDGSKEEVKEESEAEENAADNEVPVIEFNSEVTTDGILNALIEENEKQKEEEKKMLEEQQESKELVGEEGDGKDDKDEVKERSDNNEKTS